MHKVLQPLLPPLHLFTLQLLMFHRILLEHLYIRECRPFPYIHNQLQDKSQLGGNHHLVGLSFLGGNHHLVGPSLLGGNHPCTSLSGDNPHLLDKPQLLINLWQRGNPILSETLHNPREYLKEVRLINLTTRGNHTITHEEEYQILFLLDYILDNLIRVSQIPPGVLKDKNLILPKGLMFTLLREKKFTLIKGKLFIPHNQINRLILLRINQVSPHS
jgi:hypothetical protein